MNIFISGGLGFLGARTALYLSEHGFSVTIGTSSKEKYLNYILDQKIKIKLIDWTKSSSLESAIRGNQIILHLAGMNSQDCLKAPEEAKNVNGYNTKILLEIASSQKVREFIFLSTAHVYSDKLQGHFDENSPTINQHPYATSNILGEQYVKEFHNRKKINAKILRLSNTFGTPAIENDLCWNLFINNICKQIEVHKKVQIYSNPKINRNFLAISDFNYFLLQILKKDLVLEDNIILNVGSTKSFRLDEMADLITYNYYKFCKKKIEIIYKFEKDIHDKYINYEFSINKLLELGIMPSNSFESELINLFKYCNKSF